MALLSLDGVSKSYWRRSREIVVLEKVSLDVHAGEFVAVWGQRGSGKTTLATVAAGLEPPDGGSVVFDGRPLVGSSRGAPACLAQEIGFVQRLGPRSKDLERVVDFVSLPLLAVHGARKARRIASSMLTRLGVADCADARWESLTDGERTLVAVAHALVREPKLLIADDPTTSLNLLQREEVTRLLRHAVDEEGLAVLMTVPDMPEMAYAHRVGSLSDGRLTMSKAAPEVPDNVLDFPGQQASA